MHIAVGSDWENNLLDLILDLPCLLKGIRDPLTNIDLLNIERLFKLKSYA